MLLVTYEGCVSTASSLLFTLKFGMNVCSFKVLQTSFKGLNIRLCTGCEADGLILGCCSSHFSVFVFFHLQCENKMDGSRKMGCFELI